MEEIDYVPLLECLNGGVEAFAGEDSLILQGDGINNAFNRGCGRPKVKNTIGFMHDSGTGKAQEITGVQESGQTAKMHCLFSLPSKCSSLAESQGYIYHTAKDQHRCRFLQQIFEEETPRDMQLIFSEIVDHAAELMKNPFGKYLMQKLLDVCNEEQSTQILLRVTEVPDTSNEEQSTQILLRVTEVPEDLVRISLNTHG
ncbi:unnamed protein product [Fraxinus pennsylvanica]|uniref:Uncharacterized protein n=1 Tax=Fraxinus pennsylvanica TaxID=56036 RepID=A0AAD2E377_9LAMI|nr:unnamed protein product [Fraxinus pennsylvanica]